jgi:hypothetical protein
LEGKVGLHRGWDSVNWQVGLERARTLLKGRTSKGQDTVGMKDFKGSGTISTGKSSQDLRHR